MYIFLSDVSLQQAGDILIGALLGAFIITLVWNYFNDKMYKELENKYTKTKKDVIELRKIFGMK